MMRCVVPVAWCVAAVIALGAGPVRADDETKQIADDLRSADSGVRIAALSRAGELATPEALDLAAQAFAKDTDERVLAQAAWAITAIHEKREEAGPPDAKWKAAWKKVAGLLGEGMLKHREQSEVVLAAIRAMAQMGEPAFVKPLSDDLWKVKDRRVINARILALSCIRDKTAVDEIMDLLYVTARVGLEPYAPALTLALRRLTGQNFTDRVEAKKWWKENREKFEFAEVDPKKKALERRMFDKAWRDATEGKDDGK